MPTAYWKKILVHQQWDVGATSFRWIAGKILHILELGTDNWVLLMILLFWIQLPRKIFLPIRQNSTRTPISGGRACVPEYEFVLSSFHSISFGPVNIVTICWHKLCPSFVSVKDYHYMLLFKHKFSGVLISTF